MSAGARPAAAMNTFIQLCEIWAPSRDRRLLEFHAGIAGPHAAFRAASERMCFGYGEGLPGRAWAERRPIVLEDLQNSYFRRAEAARRAGLTCGVAMPVFAGDYLLAVVCFYCGGSEERAGAIELWHNDPARSSDMGLVEGHYGILDSFERVARRTLFRRGFGLPGAIWQGGMPEVFSDLWNSERFLRRDDARRVGLTKALGIPSFYKPGQNYVLTLLSALGTPIARRFEIWVPEAGGAALKPATIDCSVRPEAVADRSGVRIGPGDGPIGTAWATGLPEAIESLATDGSATGESARAAGLDALLAFPVLEEGRCKAVVGLYF